MSRTLSNALGADRGFEFGMRYQRALGMGHNSDALGPTKVVLGFWKFLPSSGTNPKVEPKKFEWGFSPGRPQNIDLVFDWALLRELGIEVVHVGPWPKTFSVPCPYAHLC